jgi:uncharacterized lipoprotein YbaY
MSIQLQPLKRAALLPVMLVLLILAACGGTGATTGEVDATPDASVTGTVTYLQRSALAPGSVVTVQIQDVSRQDVAAEIIGEQVITTTGEQVPIAFSVPYSSGAIVENNAYALQARIESPEGQLIFINDTVTPVITNGAPTSDVEMVLVPVGGSSQTEPSNTSTMPDGAVSGTVSYMQRMALVPGSVVTVQLQDVSRMDAPAQILSEQVITTDGNQPPFAFQLPYSNSQFDESARLVVRATIEGPDGNLMFTSDTVTPVLTNGAPAENVAIVVVPVGGGATAAPDATVSGTVSYMQRIALAPGSVVTVQIQDVSRQDVAAEIIGEQVIVIEDQQVPIAFEVPYSTAAIVEGNTYALQARIESPGGQLLFINDTFTPVISDGAPTEGIEMDLVAVGGGSQQTPSGTSSMPDGEVSGTLSYLQRIALAPGSVVTVQLQDISRAGAPATILSEQVITTDGEQAPFEFRLPYSNTQFEEGARLAVRATIERPDGSLQFTTDTITPVITGDAPTEGIELVLVAVGAPQTDAVVSGTVTYLQRIALAPNSVITVELQDISLADAPATVLGRSVIVIRDQQVPVPFVVPYNSADIVEGNRYAVRATITDPTGALIFTSDTVVPVITNGAPTEGVEIVVVPAG